MDLLTHAPTGPLQPFHTTGVLGLADVHVAGALLGTCGQELALASGTDADVALAAALCVRALRSGSVCIDLDADPQIWLPDEEQVAAQEVPGARGSAGAPWSTDHAAWRNRSARSPVRSLATTTPSITSDSTAGSGRPARRTAMTAGRLPRRRMVRSTPSRRGGERKTGAASPPRRLRATTARTASENCRAVAGGVASSLTTESCGLGMGRVCTGGVTVMSGWSSGGPWGISPSPRSSSSCTMA